MTRRKNSTSSGTTTIVSHAPSPNLETLTTTSVAPVAIAPAPLTSMNRGAGAAELLPVRDHAGLRQREREERADREQRNQLVGDAAERDEQRAGEHREHDDAVENTSRRPRSANVPGK